MSMVAWRSGVSLLRDSVGDVVGRSRISRLFHNAARNDLGPAHVIPQIHRDSLVNRG